MNSKGQIDQIVTSAIVFLVVLVIMGVFSYATNFASNFFDTSASVSSYDSSNGGSAALRDVFLADRVIVDGSEISVLDALKKGVEGNEEVLSVVKKRFMDKYSCGEKNYLRVIDSEVKIVKARGAEEGAPIDGKIYLSYPRESYDPGFEESVFAVGDKKFAVGVKEVARC